MNQLDERGDTELKDRNGHMDTESISNDRNGHMDTRHTTIADVHVPADETPDDPGDFDYSLLPTHLQDYFTLDYTADSDSSNYDIEDQYHVYSKTKSVITDF